MPKRRSSTMTTPTSSQSSAYSTSSGAHSSPPFESLFDDSQKSFFSSTNSSKLDEIRSRSHKLGRNEKIYRIVQFLSTSTGTPHPACFTFNSNKRDCNCESKLLQRFSWLNPDDSSSDRVEIKECQWNFEGRHFASIESDSELNRMIDTLIDYELVRVATNSVRHKDELVFIVLKKAFRELIRAINAIRFTQPTTSSHPVSKHLSNLLVDTAYLGTAADNPSIKKALCSFFLKQESALGSLKAIFYRLGEYFIFYLNNYALKPPDTRCYVLKENEEAYRTFYTRWLACCIIPEHFPSFTRYNLTDIFGNEFLSLVFDDFKRLLAKRLIDERSSNLLVSPKDNKLPYLEARLKYELLPEFLTYIEREFVGHPNSEFWHQAILGNDSTKCIVTTRNATHNCHSNELAGNLSLFSDMERFVERLKPLERVFEPNELEGAHLRFNLPLTAKGRGKGKFVSTTTNRSFCWTNYLLDKCDQFMTDQTTDLDTFTVSDTLSPRKRTRSHEPVMRFVRDPVPDLGVALQTIKGFVLQSPKLLHSKSLWLYLTRDVTHSKLHRLIRSLYEDVKRRHNQIKSITPVSKRPMLPIAAPSSATSENDAEDLIQYRLLQNTLVDNELSAEAKSKWFIQLQNVINHQLPRMGREYVSRLVYDPRHTTLIMFRKDTEHVIGGITFRFFQEQGFSEVVFCAVSSSEQVKGYGRRLMNFLKDYHTKELGIMHLLTFADQDAIGYFEKQGFTHVDLAEERERYPGCIKEYDGATLMGCWLNPLIVYSDMSHRVLFQRMMLNAIIKQRMPDLAKLPTIQYEFDHKHRVVPRSFIAQASPGQRLIYNTAKVDFKDHSRKLKPVLAVVVKKLRKHESAWPFKKPVDQNKVPDYYKVIRYPMDLRRIQERVKARYYVNLHMFHCDMRRMFQNCRNYNPDGSVYHRCGEILERFYEEQLRAVGLVRERRINNNNGNGVVLNGQLSLPSASVNNNNNSNNTTVASKVSAKGFTSKEPPIQHIK